MTVVQLSNRKYSYVHDDQTGLCTTIDSHHIFIKQSRARIFLLYLTILLLLANAFCFLWLKEKPGVLFFWSSFWGLIIVKSFYWNAIKKESVVIMPGFGVQLETHFGSGRVVRRFVPIGIVLKPVLTEYVTPVTCYWSLGLIVRGEAELLLVFQELRPPVKMLVSVWKALCAASDSKESMDTVVEDQ